MNYATRQAVREFGVTAADATDARVDAALARATAAIDSFCGQEFAGSAVKTVVLDGIYKGRIALPTPFTSITSVTVDGLALSVDQYEVRDYGLSLLNVRLRDGDGFPLYWSTVQDLPRVAATIKVTATFGTTAPQAIVDATIRLASQFAREHADDSLGAAQLATMRTGDLSYTQRSAGLTTGSVEIDDLLWSGGFVSVRRLVD